ERAAPARVIKCEGPFSRNASHAGLVKAFGHNNVTYQEIGDAQDKRIKASVLYPNDPKARLEFVWGDEKARRRPRQIRAKDQSAWTSANGIRIGTALADVEKMNGKPFKLSSTGITAAGSRTGAAACWASPSPAAAVSPSNSCIRRTPPRRI